MPDIERTLTEEQNNYSVNIEDVNYTIDIKPQNKFEIILNEQGAQGPRGFTGNGISSVIKTSSDGLVDTYTITFTDGNETTFDVTNGNGIDYISLTDIQGLIKTYTIYFDNGDTKTFEVTDGYSPTATVSKSGNVSTITITDKNGTTSTEVYDGEGNITDVTVNGVSVLDNTVANVIVPTKISDLTDDTSTNPIDKAESVVDQNSGTDNFWTGTQAQYDAITTKDTDTLYYITDDASIPISILEMLYPVGAIYIGTMSVCPLVTLGVGTWQLIAQDEVLQGAGTVGSAGDSVSAGLPNITGSANGNYFGGSMSDTEVSGAIKRTDSGSFKYGTSTSTSNYTAGFQFDASESNPIYGGSNTVQPPAYIVNVWERVS